MFTVPIGQPDITYALRAQLNGLAADPLAAMGGTAASSVLEAPSTFIGNNGVIPFSLAANIPGARYSFDPADYTLGSELNPNTTFTTQTGWSGISTVTYTGGTVNFATSNSRTVQITANAPQIVLANLYLLSYDITAYTGGNIACLGVVLNTAVGSHSHIILAQSNASVISLSTSGLTAFTGSIDNLSVKLVTPKCFGTDTNGTPLASKRLLRSGLWRAYNGPQRNPHLGLLSEPTILQDMTGSENMTTATTWNITRTGITKDSIESPFNGSKAATIKTTATSGTHYITSDDVNTVTGKAHTTSLYFQYQTGITHCLIVLGTNFPATARNITVDLEARTVSAKHDDITAEINLLPDGWFQLLITATASASLSSAITIHLATSNPGLSVPSYTGNILWNVGIWMPQFNIGTKELGAKFTDTRTSPNGNHLKLVGTEIGAGLHFDIFQFSRSETIQKLLSSSSALEKLIINTDETLSLFTGLLGSELISNGTFDTDTTGWTPSASAVLSIDTGRLKLTNPTSTTAVYGYQAVTTIIGKKYWLLNTQTNGTAVAQLHVGTVINGIQYSGDAPSTFEFTATTTTTYLTCYITPSVIGEYAFFDNISLKELVQLTTTAVVTPEEVTTIGIRSGSGGAKIWINGELAASDPANTTAIAWPATTLLGEDFWGTISCFASSNDANFNPGEID